MRSGRVLVQVLDDPATGERFHRVIGGGIEFGETSELALRREFSEELGIELGTVVLLGVIESIFEYGGEPGHEVVHLYAVESEALDALPEDIEMTVLDEGSPVRWVPLTDPVPLYPEGTRELVEAWLG